LAERRSRHRRGKSNLQKAKDRPGSKYWRAKADVLWGQLIRKKNGGCCIYCGEPATDSHHLIGRDVGHLRHDLNNGIPLCRHHHRLNSRVSAHGSPTAFNQWLLEQHPELWRWVQEHKHELGKPDYRAAHDALKAALDGTPHA